MDFLPALLIKKKRDGAALEAEEISFFIDGFHRGTIPDYQMSAMLMAMVLKGLGKQEAAHLTQAMLNSGERVTFSGTKHAPVDKHSTGGVGDKTSLLIAPIVAACGVPVPMISGRGLGHTGGTLDKLESIPGFDVNLSLSKFKQQVESLGLAMIGQTEEICPADKKMYALRDVTATVESIGLICGSILSKKIAEGIKGLVMDVKYGSGAFMKTSEHAEELARWLTETAHHNGLNTTAYITSMEEPLGRCVGNAVEIGECLSILGNTPFLSFKPQDFSDTRELALVLSAEMLCLSGRCRNLSEAKTLASQKLDDGSALDIFKKMVTAQGGRLDQFHFPEMNWQILSAEQDGFLSSYDTEAIGFAAIALGAGRKTANDKIDMNASILVHKKVGDPVKKGEILLSYAAKVASDAAVAGFLKKSFKISLQKPTPPSLILKRIGKEWA